MDRKTKEAVRYLGYGNHAVDEKTLALIQDVFNETDRIAEHRIIYRIFDLNSIDDDCVYIEHLKIKSKNLKKNLSGCEQVIMLAATLGTEIDYVMRKYSHTDIARAAVMQACAAVLLEEYLDEFQSSVGYYTKPRFSPGYGDFSIEFQKDILELLQASKTIGLSITDNSMLVPTKSVTAVIGISNKAVVSCGNRCMECAKTDCNYRNTKE